MFVEFLSGEKHGGKTPVTADTAENFTDAGYLLTENDLVVDIDCISHETIEALIRIFRINTETVWTERGAHLYFKKPEVFRGAQKVCALGFKIEYKHIKNTYATTIKRNGVMRTIQNPGVREDVPEFFGSRRKFTDMTAVDEGNRNNAMFDFRVKLGNMNNWANMMRFVNDFIIPVGLDEKEFQSICRDNLKLDGKDASEAMIARELAIKYGAVNYNGNLFHKYQGRFTDDPALTRKMIDTEVPDMPIRWLNEVVAQLPIKAKSIHEQTVFPVKFKNGILLRGAFIEIEYDEYTPYDIDIEYKPDAVPVKRVDDYLTHLTAGEPEYRLLIEEIMGSTLITDGEFKSLLARFFIFVGGGGNGKSTLLKIEKGILGAENITALSPEDLTKDAHLCNLPGKLANLGDDIGNVPINNDQMKMLKNISSCDDIAIRALYENSHTGRITASLMFTSNHILKSFEKGDSYTRRVMWLPVYTKPKTKELDFIGKLVTDDAREYWLRLMIEGYLRLYAKSRIGAKDDFFTISPKVKQFNGEYHEENNPCTQFISDQCGREYFFHKKPVDVYNTFKEWLIEQGEEVGKHNENYLNKTLKETICSEFGFKIGRAKINKLTTRVFVDIDDAD